MSRTARQKTTLSKNGKRLGRPTVLTADKIDRFLTLIEQGNHLVTAAAAVGWHKSSLFHWLSDAETIRQEITADVAAGRAPRADHSALRLVDFSDRLALARAKAETKVVATVGRVIEGGHLISRKPALTGDGMPIYDEDGALVYEEVYAQPDGKLGLEFLSRSFPDRWGRLGPQQVEISGPGGAPIAVESTAQVSALAERLAAHLAIAGGPEDADEVHDAEIVEEGDRAAG